MYGFDIDDRPDAPVGTPQTRRTVAIYWNWSSEYTQEEIAAALGVTEPTVRRYVREGPTDQVKEQMDDKESEVRVAAVAELKQQLQAAGHRAKTAQKPVKIYENEHGEVEVIEFELESGETKKIPKVQDIQLLPDQQARFYARDESRDILEQLINLVGAAEANEHDVSLSWREALAGGDS